MNRLKRGIIAVLALISMVSVGTLDVFAQDALMSNDMKKVTLADPSVDVSTYANISLSGLVYLKGRAWETDEQPCVDIYKKQSNGDYRLVMDIESYGNFNEGGRSFSGTYSANNEEAKDVVHEFKLRLKDKVYKSIIRDNSEFIVYVKSEYKGFGVKRVITYSLDGINYDSEKPAISFENTYFTKTLNVTREDGDGEYDLYTYTSGQPSMNNPTKTLVKALNTVNGSLSEQLEEGKYFLKETKAPAGFELSNTIYDFEVSAANYQQPQEFNIKTQLKKEEPDKGEEPEVKPEDPKDQEDKPLPDPEVPEIEPKPEVPENPTPKPETTTPQPENPTPASEPAAPKNDHDVNTADHTNTSLYIALLALSASLVGAMVFRKRNHNA